MDFKTKSTGKPHEEFTTGSVRDSQDGKPRYDLIHPVFLRRVAELLERGAQKYGERNWEKGQPVSRSYASMFRHMMQWSEGDVEEDHLAAIAFNVMTIMYVEEMASNGELAETLADYGATAAIVKKANDMRCVCHVCNRMLTTHEANRHPGRCADCLEEE